MTKMGALHEKSVFRVCQIHDASQINRDGSFSFLLVIGIFAHTIHTHFLVVQSPHPTPSIFDSLSVSPFILSNLTKFLIPWKSFLIPACMTNRTMSLNDGMIDGFESDRLLFFLLLIFFPPLTHFSLFMMHGKGKARGKKVCLIFFLISGFVGSASEKESFPASLLDDNDR